MEIWCCTLLLDANTRTTKRIGDWIMEDELVCYFGRWIRKDELKYKTEATNTISNKHLYSNNRE